eukprot:TRINITY_DN5452_c0_g1_i3.p1 TRINITY_DN5452_c0_g1~~TRINITY_DN5452_c0_g1_i3.p1  ORF type:complete len:122 (+),score=5.48 TRINITY_DN5452_c0_g1_i3:83-448(+)
MSHYPGFGKTCADPYTKQMYPEHSKFATLMLTMPIGSYSVERCFSYTTRIGGDDKRQSLTEKHIQQLDRISQQVPPFPSSGYLTWPLTVSEKTPQEATLDSFSNDTFEKWLQAPRRLFPQK